MILVLVAVGKSIKNAVVNESKNVDQVSLEIEKEQICHESSLVIKISYSKKVYRLISISESSAYHDLHLNIQTFLIKIYFYQVKGTYIYMILEKIICFPFLLKILARKLAKINTSCFNRWGLVLKTSRVKHFINSKMMVRINGVIIIKMN